MPPASESIRDRHRRASGMQPRRIRPLSDRRYRSWPAGSASPSRTMAVVLVALAAIGLGCVTLVAYRVGQAVAIEAAGRPTR
jgi:hypothetical protein